MAKQATQERLSGILGNISSFRPRLNRRTALEAAVLGMVVVLAIIFRAMRVRWGPYMDAFDPLFQLRVTEYVVENGYKSWFTWYDMRSWYPWGRDIAVSSYPGVPFSGAFVYFVARALGLDVTVYNVCLYFPVMMGALTCIVAYFLGKDLGGSSTGLFAAFFLAISESFIGRTGLGFYDTENLGIFGMTTTVFLFLRSLDKERTSREKLIYAVASGLSLGFIFASWGAARYVVGLLALYALASLVLGKFERQTLISYSATMVIGYAIALMVPKLGLRYIYSVENTAAILLILLLAAYDVMRQRLDERRTLLLIAGLVVSLVVGLVVLEAVGLSNPLGGKFRRVVFPSSSTENPLSESVAEHKRSTWTSFWGSYGLTFPIAILGVYFAVTYLDEKHLLHALYFLTAVYFTGSMTRLSLILSIPVSILAAFGLTELLNPFVSLSRRREEGRRRRRRAWLGLSRELSMVFAVFIMIGLMPTIWGTAESSIRPTSLASSGTPALMGGQYPRDWMQALSWMKENLAEDAVVLSWWDYGYWIEAVADKITMADGATSNQSQIGYIGRIMMYNQTDALPMLEAYDVTHVVVFYTFNPGNPQQQWPFGDNVKWSWMVQIGGLNLTEYVDMSTGQPTQKYGESTLYRLMTRNPDTAFNIAFVSDYSFVMVYEVDYEAA